MRAAIKKKADRTAPAQRAEIVLALDAIETVSQTFGPVLAEFFARHKDWAASLGFAAIWIVGPNVALTQRLD